MSSLKYMIKRLKTPLLEDGVISLGETSVLLRALRPFVLKGDATACELRDLLLRVRGDGVITHEESERVRQLMDKIVDGDLTLERYVAEIPNYPFPDMTFYDTSRLMDTPWLFRLVLDKIDELIADVEFDLVASPATRGLIFGSAVAARHGAGFVPVRAPGKFPQETITEGYDASNGRIKLSMLADSVMRGERVLIVDELVSTGRTAKTVAKLVERLGGNVVKMVFPVELEGHGAREAELQGYDVVSLIKYSSK